MYIIILNLKNIGNNNDQIIKKDKKNILYKQYFIHSVKDAIISSKMFNNDNGSFYVNRLTIDDNSNEIYVYGIMSIHKTHQQLYVETRSIKRQHTVEYKNNFDQLVNSSNTNDFTQQIVDTFDLKSHTLSINKINIGQDLIYQNDTNNHTDNKAETQVEMTQKS
eukprot:232735_1